MANQVTCCLPVRDIVFAHLGRLVVIKPPHGIEQRIGLLCALVWVIVIEPPHRLEDRISCILDCIIFPLSLHDLNIVSPSCALSRISLQTMV